MFDVGCEFCGDVPRDLIYLPNYTKRIEEQNISMGRPNKYIRSEDVFFVCSCGIVASSVDRSIYNEFWSSRVFEIDVTLFFLERNQTSSKCPF
mgnify:CR=1 FL=1